ncbi:cobalamin biosynthesis protein [Bacillus sp. FJAT-18017]|uniref:CobW family GTP-binding protein n=1 Tax=Bacillus sp. FJAT-18017 TaxID=1705566 RepID=UPI0006AF89A5|nr:CobW family GTP-binding protein [Bacillus sp. FJAT-18017]ALC90217.1 cobalamin biosynthesis protein [Bacillus sp. FJAT-18017]
MGKTEIYILSGFLGSGKTTLLKRLLEDEKKNGRKVAVMMNELGAVSIDSDAVGEDVALKELLGGCICCTMSGQVEAQLQGLLQLEKPDSIYVETTGAAHPVEILDALVSPLFADKIIPKGIITTVDGQRWLDRVSLGPQLQQLLLEQVRHADYLIVNKASDLSEKQQADAITSIQGLNSHAKCVLTDFSKVPLKDIRAITLLPGERKHTHIHTKDLGLGTYVHTFSAGVQREDFEQFLRSLPDSIYRIKGYVKFKGASFPELFQYSYGMPSYMKEYMNLPLNMVFIGEGIDWESVSNGLKALEKGE